MGDRIGYQPTAATDPEVGKEKLQRILALDAAGQKQLIGGTAWTVRGKTTFAAEYLYHLDGEPQVFLNTAATPPGEGTSEHADFVVTHGAVFLDMIEAGQADFLGTVDMMIDGIFVRMEVWHASFGDWGDVRYMRGKPIF
jgi:hypothetical protein